MNGQAIGQEQTSHWTEVIEPRTGLLDVRLGEVWRYRDLVMMFVKRDFTANYKQTILGPIWFFLQPLLTSLTYLVIFGRMAGLSTDGLPQIIFYLSGVTVWNYFSESLNKTATVFKDNAQIFGKVYFPRLAMPLSIIVSNLVRFVIQYSLFLAIWAYYLITTDALHPNWMIVLTPALIVIMGLMALGLGMIISALTTKYKDLILLLVFGTQLLMFATPVIIPLSKVAPKLRIFMVANPMTGIMETFRYAYLGKSSFSWNYLAYSTGFSLVVLFVGVIIFNKVEKSFMDSV